MTIFHEASHYVTLSVGEVEVWMAALRMAARSRKVPVTPWDSCGFIRQHGELVVLTGYGKVDHEALLRELRPKEEPAA